MEDGIGRAEKIVLRKWLLLRQQNPRPISLSEARIGPAPCFEDGNHVEHSESLHALRMVQGQAVRNASSAIMADQREGRKAEFVHHFHQFLRHGTFGIRKVVVSGSWYPAAAIGAQIYADHSVTLRQLGR